MNKHPEARLVNRHLYVFIKARVDVKSNMTQRRQIEGLHEGRHGWEKFGRALRWPRPPIAAELGFLYICVFLNVSDLEMWVGGGFHQDGEDH